jgi:hypothetical protein
LSRSTGTSSFGSNRALTQPDLPSPYPVGSAQENIVIAASPESGSLHDIP